MKITDKQQLLIKYYFESSTILEASKKAGISNVTASRYMKDPKFLQKLNDYQQKAIDKNLTCLQNLLANANDCLLKLLKDGSNNQKLQACKIIYDNAFKSLEITEIRNRLSLLENCYSDNEN